MTFFIEVHFKFGNTDPHHVVWTVKPSKEDGTWVLDKRINDKNEAMAPGWVMKEYKGDKRFVSDPQELIRRIFNYED